ncbi:hypothetical protein ABIF68_011095 [Bradyrhizobium japonicum]|nr:hypothetical protein [Bradyrhizobium japonicum]MCP1748695.1 hypothetical protein [Bradyrhizobium japonicum]MCP1768987.1 hypothetical protein [Bradyrhizobium japonicum]MCP1780764.1 hypothetical protein [Bradyrhizobium japonicum]MCP1784691.1 hypothetical protein [Bradyrhizobium japonicum]
MKLQLVVAVGIQQPAPEYSEESPKFSTLIIAQYQGRKSLGRHQILRHCCSRHLWHSDANLMRIYDCELVTREL